MTGYDISIVLISSHDSAVSELNIDNSIDQSLLPFLELINKLANFTISSQVRSVNFDWNQLKVSTQHKYMYMYQKM